MFEPSGQAQPAEHLVHALRVKGVPPEVYEPGAHVEQDDWPGLSLYTESLPQSWHDELELELNLPATHWAGEPEPSQLYPATQGEHAVCVFASPPEVKRFAGHVAHVDCPSPLYLVSAPHGLQASAVFAPRASLYVPAPHLCWRFFPSHQ